MLSLACQEKNALGPLGMKSSAFFLNRTIERRLAEACLPVANDRGGFRQIECPHFELGINPAGNLHTTAEDLGRFLSRLFAEAQAGGLKANVSGQRLSLAPRGALKFEASVHVAHESMFANMPLRRRNR